MSLTELFLYALLALVGFIVANALVWYPTRNTQKANHVKKGQTEVLVFSVVAYAIVLVVLVYSYSVQAI